MTTLTITWKASEALQCQEILATGSAGKCERQTQIDLATLEPAQRAEVLVVAQMDRYGEPKCSIDLTRLFALNEKTPDFLQEDASRWTHSASKEWDHEPTLDETVEAAGASILAQRLAKDYAAAAQAKINAEKKAKQAAEQAEFDRLMAVYQDLKPHVLALVAGDDLAALDAWTWPTGYNQNFPQCRPFETYSREDSLSTLIYKRKTALQEAAVEAAKAAWIEEHGSDHLKRAYAAGHDAGRLYWIERAALEYPGFTLDYQKHAEWKTRSCPSVRMLDKRDEVLAAHPKASATIVWLTDEPRERVPAGEWDYENFEEHEALVVDDPDYTRYLVF